MGLSSLYSEQVTQSAERLHTELRKSFLCWRGEYLVHMKNVSKQLIFHMKNVSIQSNRSDGQVNRASASEAVDAGSIPVSGLAEGFRKLAFTASLLGIQHLSG